MGGQPHIEDYSLWLLPNKSQTEHLQKIVNDLSEQEPSCPTFIPHITLFSPVPRSANVHSIVADLEAIVKQTKRAGGSPSLELMLKPAQSGKEYYQSVLAPIEPNAYLKALRIACEDEWGGGGKTYFPHLSLLYGDLTQERRDELAGIVNEGKGNRLPEQVKIEEIAVVDCRNTPDKWEIVGRVEL